MHVFHLALGFVPKPSRGVGKKPWEELVIGIIGRENSVRRMRVMLRNEGVSIILYEIFLFNEIPIFSIPIAKSHAQPVQVSPLICLVEPEVSGRFLEEPREPLLLWVDALQ